MSDNYQATFGAPLTRAELVADNPYVPQFEFLQESDAPYGVKVGPGYWNDLPYLAQSGVKVYRATLTQNSTTAPVATVLENTLGGTVVWSYSDVGVYIATLTGAFPTAAKTFLQLTYGGNQGDPGSDGIVISTYWQDADSIVINSFDVAGTPAEMNVNSAALQILVYP